MYDLENIVLHCRFLLNNSSYAEACLSYLNERLSADMQDKFVFGYFPPNHCIDLMTNVLGTDILKKNGLMYSKDIQDSHSFRSFNFSFFDNHPLVLPYRDVYGNVIAIVGRTLLDDKERSLIGIPKYKNTHFTKGDHLFGLYEAKQYILKSGFVYIVEGQFDVIKAVERGLKNIVALGNSNMTSNQLALICRYTKNIVMLLDNDDAGVEGRERAYKKYKNFADIKINTYLPKGYKDIDEYLKVNDVDSVATLL